MTHCPWSDYAPATIHFCEERICGWVVEPSNAWSNLGYVIVGLVILARARWRTPQILIGIASVLIGFGSFGLHGTGTRIGELVDVGGMYLLSALGVVYALRRVWSMSSLQLVLGYVAIVATSVALMIAFHSNGIFVFATQIAITTFAEIYLYLRGTRFPSYAAQKGLIASFTTAFAIWNLDKWNILCAPENHFITGHAVWHVLTALAVYFFSRQQAQTSATQRT